MKYPTNYSRTLRSLFAAVLLLGFSTGAFAQATRTWVSGVGDDVNPCSRTAPCKTFAGAISKTAEGGEISVLDPGGFGGVTITKGMTLEGSHGSGFGSILNASTSGVIVNISSAGINHPNDAVVIIRNIYFQGASHSVSGSNPSNGIRYLRGARLFVDHCSFLNQTTNGIDANLTSAGSLFVHDCQFENTNTAIRGTTTVNPLTMNIKDITVHGNTNGVLYTNNASGTVTGSMFAAILGGSAVSAGSNCFVNVSDSHFSNSSTAINALAGSFVRVNGNELYDNTNGFAGVAGAFQTGGNNKLAGNSASVAPSGTALLNQ